MTNIIETSHGLAIYQYDNKFAVQSVGNKNRNVIHATGNMLFATIEEAREHAERVQKRENLKLKAEAERVAALELQQAQDEARLDAINKPINDYCDSIGASRMQRGKILSVLSKEYNFNGVWQTRAKFIQDAVEYFPLSRIHVRDDGLLQAHDTIFHVVKMPVTCCRFAEWLLDCRMDSINADADHALDGLFK